MPHAKAAALLADIEAAAPQRREKKRCFAASWPFFIFHLPSWRTPPALDEPLSKNYILNPNLSECRRGRQSNCVGSTGVRRS